GGSIANIKKWIILYPVYINSKKTIAEGRQIYTTKGCETLLALKSATVAIISNFLSQLSLIGDLCVMAFDPSRSIRRIREISCKEGELGFH
ncbi:hypothetical protein RJ641_009911, partial [Dillenia turbinata]